MYSAGNFTSHAGRQQLHLHTFCTWSIRLVTACGPAPISHATSLFYSAQNMLVPVFLHDHNADGTPWHAITLFLFLQLYFYYYQLDSPVAVANC